MRRAFPPGWPRARRTTSRPREDSAAFVETHYFARIEVLTMKRKRFSLLGQTIFIALVALGLALIPITRTPRAMSSDDVAKRKAAAEHFREIMSRGIGSEV